MGPPMAVELTQAIQGFSGVNSLDNQRVQGDILEVIPGRIFEAQETNLKSKSGLLGKFF